MYPKNTKTKKTTEVLTDLQYVEDYADTPISLSLDENELILNELFQDCSDLIIRPFSMTNGTRAIAVLVDGLVISDIVDDALRSVMLWKGTEQEEDVEEAVEEVFPVSQISMTDNYKELLLGVLGGDTAILIDNRDQAVLWGIRGPVTRGVSEPSSEESVRGPREGFIEHLRTNTSLLRRKIRSPRLKMKPMVIGKHSNTDIVVSYIEGLTNTDLVNEVVQRLEKIDIDGVLESGYLEEFIQDSSYSPFPQLQYSEKPDTVAAALLQGRVAVLVDGTPFALLAPTTFFQLMQASEDYYEKFQIATLIRWLRYLFLIMSLLIPALYVAITTFHQDLLPTGLLLSIAAARETIPFPAVVEALIMEVIFEALREAGIRLPRAVGSAIGILGALVIGQAAVEAGIVSAPMVIVVSITGIASFTIPHFSGAIAVRMLRFPLLIIASIFGIYGVLVGLMLILGHMANLRSFGVPYLSPLGPTNWKDLKDVLLRAPQWSLTSRPSFVGAQDNIRVNKALSHEISEHKGQKGIGHNDSDQSNQTSDQEGEGS